MGSTGRNKMSDPWVLETQKWLNLTYGANPQFEEVAETGKTGWATMYALTRALQIELGLSTLSDSFGPGTEAAVDAISPINSSTSNLNIIRAVQGALYCKGYDGGGGNLDGVYSATTTAGVQELRTDIGLGSSNGFMTTKVLKALLTMDAYVLLDGGSPEIRAIQRDLNGRYLQRKDFYVLPADGNYSRNVQNALLYAIQYEIGMADGTANGNFGPGTKAGIQSLGNFGSGATDSANGNYLVHLFQAALTFNGYPTAFDGIYGTTTVETVRSFQAFYALPVNGRADFQTWAALLVSTGDVNRPGTAADTIATITPARAATLVANGYETVGRYLTNSPVADPLDKNIKPDEISTIFDAGLSIVPIFQEGGDYLEYFTFSRGLYAGHKAYEAARAYGFKPGTPIYFAVDFDAVEDEVWSNVMPYFEGIDVAMRNSGRYYRVGVYGARNTCSIISREGLARLSYVSDMSTGYSGNLGYPLPPNWAFDQILEYEIGTGASWVNIDKNIKSGRDIGQHSVDVPATVSPRAADVQLPTGSAFTSAFLDDVEAELKRQMTDEAEELALNPRRSAASLALQHDALITSLSNELQLRKAFIQTVLVWEAACIKQDDILADAAVIATYKFLLNNGIEVPIKRDSSTGLCQIFAETAISAANWTKTTLNVAHGIPGHNAILNQDMWNMWQQLQGNPSFNIKMAALVLLEKAGSDVEGNLDLIADRGLLMSPTQEQVEITLGEYNGDLAYGTRRRELYNLFEWHNAQQRV